MAWGAVLVLVLVLGAGPAGAAEIQLRSLILPNGDQMDLRTVAAPGKRLILWLPCDQGLGTAELAAAQHIADGGDEVWLADLLGAHFLPVAPSAMKQIPGEEVEVILEQARRETGKDIYLVAAGGGAVAALRGAAVWLKSARPAAEREALRGIVLIYPELYVETPKPGQMARYLPIVAATPARVVILQPQLTPARFWLDRLKETLESGGAQVVTEVLPGVRGYFFVRNDATPAETALALQLPDLVLRGVDILEKGDKQ
jgi:hypothetical protein